MLLAIAFALANLCAGYAVLRALGLAKGLAAAALAPAAGLALTTTLASWLGLVGAPEPAAGIVVLACVATGVALLVRDRETLVCSAQSFVQSDSRTTAALSAASLAVPIIAMGLALGGIQAPLSPHDGAFHVETSDAFRHASATSNWYPPGLAALFGALLQLLPWVDSALGATDLGLGLTLLAPIAVFGLGVVLCHDLKAAAAAALFVALTHLFAYYPQIWSGWPQLLGILLVLGLWVAASQYLEHPSWRWAVLAGLLVGPIVLVHGTELYTSAIVLLVLLVANLRRLPWTSLGLHVPAALVLAVICAAPYLPALLHWAGAGGAYQVGFEDGTALEQGSKSASAGQLLAAFVVDALGVDFPIRIVLIALGIVWAVKRHLGGVVFSVTLIFLALALAATFLNGLPLVRQVFSATYPWSLPYRHLTFASITFALVAGWGVLQLARWWNPLLARIKGIDARRRVERVSRLLVITWLILATWALEIFLAIEAGGDVSFTSDDAAAMGWMRQNVERGAIVVNDTFADAGIWAPYKAGVQILVHRSSNDPEPDVRYLIIANVGQLDQNPSAAAAACSRNARYVYRGAANAAWQVRSFPSIAELRAAPALEEVFGRGEAAVFRIRLNC